MAYSGEDKLRLDFRLKDLDKRNGRAAWKGAGHDRVKTRLVELRAEQEVF